MSLYCSIFLSPGGKEVVVCLFCSIYLYPGWGMSGVVSLLINLPVSHVGDEWSLIYLLPPM